MPVPQLEKYQFKPAEKHWNWSGDKVGYWGVHKWIQRHHPHPKQCQECSKEGAYHGKTRKFWNIEWANISKEYKRDFSDWKPLCRSCHNKFDRS